MAHFTADLALDPGGRGMVGVVAPAATVVSATATTAWLGVASATAVTTVPALHVATVITPPAVYGEAASSGSIGRGLRSSTTKIHPHLQAEQLREQLGHGVRFHLGAHGRDHRIKVLV